MSSLSQDKLAKLQQKAAAQQAKESTSPKAPESRPVRKPSPAPAQRQPDNKKAVVIGVVIGLAIVIGVIAAVLISSNGNKPQQPVTQPDVSASEPSVDDTFFAAGDGEIVGNETTLTPSDKTPAASEDESSEQEDTDSDETAVTDQENEETDDVVSVSIPAFASSAKTQDEVAAFADEKGWFGGQLEDNGSIVYTLTVTDRDAMLKELKDDMDAKISSYQSSGTIQSAEVNADWTVVTVTVSNPDASGIQDVALDLFKQCSLYNAYDSRGSFPVMIEIKDAEGNHVTAYREGDFELQ